MDETILARLHELQEARRGTEDNLPAMMPLSRYREAPPQPEELIEGILRRGHKMLISGGSKAGKSFLLMELCVAIAEGGLWLDTFRCRKGRVLYVNLEIDHASAVNRFLRIYEAKGIPREHDGDIVIWTLRGHAEPMDKLVTRIVRRMKNKQFDAVVIDPIYKVITGDENSAGNLGVFCNQFDRICAETGCSTICCHHHSKGAQGFKRAMDRASGSGVFARDPDAQLDVIRLELTREMQKHARDGNATAWRMESSLREFANITPLNFWFEYPIHRPDTEGVLEAAAAEGDPQGNLVRAGRYSTREERRSSVDRAYDALKPGGPVTVKAMAEFNGLTERCVRDRLRELDDLYWVRGGVVGRRDADS